MTEFRYATRGDGELLLGFIRKLAHHIRMPDDVVADAESLEKWLFDRKKAEVLFAVEDGKEFGFILFFNNFSTFLGRAGIHIEDLYFDPEYRGKGDGRLFYKKIAEIAVKEGYGRIEWSVQDWNKPTIAMSGIVGAEAMSEWTVYRIAGDTLQKMGSGNSIPEGVEFRTATREDTGLILHYIRELAQYEKLLDQVVADEKTLEEWIFDRNKAEVIFPVVNGKEIGFALYFHSFSTFLGRAGLYLEDLYIMPEYRGKGYGKATLTKLAEIAVERDCGRFEWWCLDWNKPSIDFYLSLGAVPMSEWTVYRVAGDTLVKWGTGKDRP